MFISSILSPPGAVGIGVVPGSVGSGVVGVGVGSGVGVGTPAAQLVMIGITTAAAITSEMGTIILNNPFFFTLIPP